MDGWITHVSALLCLTSCQTAPYPHSPSSWAGWQSKDLGSSWIAATCRLPRLSWRCRPYADVWWCVAYRKLQLGHALGWSDSVPQCAWLVHGRLGFEQGECYSCCHNREELDPWWEHSNPSMFFSAKRLHMRQLQCPVFSLCARQCNCQLFFAAPGYGSVAKGEDESWMLIVWRLCSRPNRHQCTLRV